MAYVQVHWSPLCRVWLRGNIKVAFWLTLKGWPCEVVTGCFSASHFLEKLQIDTKEVSGPSERNMKETRQVWTLMLDIGGLWTFDLCAGCQPLWIGILLLFGWNKRKSEWRIYILCDSLSTPNDDVVLPPRRLDEWPVFVWWGREEMKADPFFLLAA